MKLWSLAVLLASTALAADPWIRLAQPGFEVWTDAGETKAKQALHSLQQIRQILTAVDPLGAPHSRTLRLILFRSDAEFARFRPLGNMPAVGFFFARPPVRLHRHWRSNSTRNSLGALSRIFAFIPA